MSQATEAAKLAMGPLGVTCPRCQKPLIDPNGLGWCKACGYCKSLAECDLNALEAAAKPAPTLAGLTATGTAIGQSPRWVWDTLMGLGAVIAVTLAVGKFLPLTPFQRALITTTQMSFGLGFMFVGQFIGLLRLAPDDPTMTFKDAVIPFRLYAVALKHLPATQWTIHLGAWGLTAVITANLFVGGMLHWLEYLPSSKDRDMDKAAKVQRVNTK